VVALVRDKAGLVEGMPASIGPLARLRQEATRIKEDLFAIGDVDEELDNGQFVSASLGELHEREPIKSFGNEL
jgi:hypothetical protein